MGWADLWASRRVTVAEPHSLFAPAAELDSGASSSSKNAWSSHRIVLARRPYLKVTAS